MSDSLQAREHLARSWQIFKKNWLVIFKYCFFAFLISLIVTIVIGALTNALDTTQKANSNNAIKFAINLINWYTTSVLGIGLGRIYLKILRNQSHSLNDFKVPFKIVFSYFVGGILTTAVILAGYILLIVPGIIWGIKYGYTLMLIFDKGLTPLEALKVSGQITNGHKKDLFLFGFLMFGIILLGVLALGVGLFVAIPVATLTQYSIYNTLSSKVENRYTSK